MAINVEDVDAQPHQGVWTLVCISVAEILDHKWLDRAVRVLAVVALLVAAYELTEVNRLVDALPTRYVDEFPDNLDYLTSFIKGSNKSLYVMTDFVGYGSFSNPNGFDKYFATLRNKDFSDFDLKVLAYDAQLAERMLCVQFQQDADVTVDCDDWVHKGRVPLKEDFRKKHDLPVGMMFDDFLKERITSQAESRSRLCHLSKANPNVEFRTSKVTFGAFVWIRDGTEMVVSFLNGDQNDEFSFRNDYKDIVKFFTQDFDKRFKNANSCDADSDRSTFAPSNVGEQH